MRRRAVREVVDVEGEEEGFGGAPSGIGTLLDWSVVMLLKVEFNASKCCVAAIVINVERRSWSRERADLPRYLSLTIIQGSLSVVHTSWNSHFDRSTQPNFHN